MPFRLAAVSGISWITSQCSKILPFSGLDMSTTTLQRDDAPGLVPEKTSSMHEFVV